MLTYNLTHFENYFKVIIHVNINKKNYNIPLVDPPRTRLIHEERSEVNE